MTTPAAPPVTTGSFAGVPFPIDVQAQIINLLVGGAPFADSLTRQPTNRSQIGWPTAEPTGFSWLAELQPFPEVDLGDDSYVVAVAKLGAVIDLSNESVDDASINLTAGLADVLRDSLSRDLDLGLLNGSGPLEPVGVIRVAAETAGASLFAAAMTARGEIADAGGTATTLAASGAALAAADATMDANGQLVYPNGMAAALGLTAVSVPGLDPALVYDRSRCYLVVRNDVAVEFSRDYHFNRDATSMRVKGRFAAAIPAPAKAIRKLDVSAAPRGAAKSSGKS
jgi:HK97 family phage major capsid protein